MSSRIIEGDCREVLAGLEPGSVQTCITSPPYWGLRDYGTATWEGGDAECDHIRTQLHENRATRPQGWNEAGNFRNTSQPREIGYAFKCGKCGATRIDSQLGLEPTPEEYVANLVEVFREVKRVLRDDGTLWLNLGDSYCSTAPGTTNAPERIAGADGRDGERGGARARMRPDTPAGLKPKDLVGIPWRVAFALQADGWWLRSDIIWAKPNPMPESVTDRPTRSHEYIFLLTKRARYFYDADAIREESIGGGNGHGATWDDRKAMGFQGDTKHPTKDAIEAGLSIPSFASNPAGRNRRSVWTVTTQPYSEAHFATFPPKLIEPCVLAGSPPKCCGECGAAWERVAERKTELRDTHLDRERVRNVGGRKDGYTQLPAGGVLGGEIKMLGWRSTCDHDDDLGSSIVLDPFNGAGTTGLVAVQHGRDYIGIELNPEYAEMTRERLRRYEANPNGYLDAVEPIPGQTELQL